MHNKSLPGFETLIVERRGPAVWITLNRPERLNAITPTLAVELNQVFTALKTDESARVAVLRGAGRAFCAGLDVTEQAAPTGDGGGLARLPEIIVAMRECPQPVIALVHGPACGGGFAFALASDIRIAGESARMNDAFVNLGLSGCELGLTFFLPRQVGMSVAAELMYTGRFIDANRALRVGLVSSVVPDDHLEAEAERLIADMLRLSPIGLRTTKATFNKAMDLHDLSEVIRVEMEGQSACMQEVDFAAEIRAIAERRAPAVSRD